MAPQAIQTAQSHSHKVQIYVAAVATIMLAALVWSLQPSKPNIVGISLPSAPYDPAMDTVMATDPLGVGKPVRDMPAMTPDKAKRLHETVKAETDARAARLAALKPIPATASPDDNGAYVVQGTVKAVAIQLSGSYAAAIISVSDDGKKWRHVATSVGPPGSTQLLADLGKSGVTARHWRVASDAPPNIQTAAITQVQFLR